MAHVNATGRRIVLILVFAMLPSFALETTALAQAGSAGGTIGKTDKSVSGGEAPSRRVAKRSSERTNHGSLCDRVAGSWEWHWLNSSTVVTLSADGTSSAGNGNSGNWTCTGKTVVISWRSGPDNLTLSPDAKRLDGRGPWGIYVTGMRM
jgi:hypothetical protein